MRYAKPNVVLIGSAISTVQSCVGAKNGNLAEGPPCNTHIGTHPAYEADE
jgi:hypothetical protein